MSGLATIRLETLKRKRKLNQAPELLPVSKRPRKIETNSKNEPGARAAAAAAEGALLTPRQEGNGAAPASRGRGAGQGKRGVGDPLTWRR